MNLTSTAGAAWLHRCVAADLGSDQQICGAGSLYRAQLKHEHRVGVQTTWGKGDEHHLPVVSLGLIKSLQSCRVEASVGSVSLRTSREDQEGGTGARYRREEQKGNSRGEQL